MKNLIPFLIVILAVVGCQENPQKKAEREAKKLEKQAQDAANKAQDAYDKTVDNATEAFSKQALSDMNAAMAAITPPTFEANSQASELAKKIANEGNEYLNSKTAEEAGRNVDKLRASFAQIDKLEESGKITPEQATTIRDYAQQLADAVSVKISEVQVEVEPADAE